jgi:hypothetical protein
MRGAITGKDVVFCALEIVRRWGFATWLLCLWAAITGKPRTFLGVLHPAPRSVRHSEPPTPGGAHAGKIVLAAGLSRRNAASLAVEQLRSPLWRLSR